VVSPSENIETIPIKTNIKHAIHPIIGIIEAINPPTMKKIPKITLVAILLVLV